MSANRAAQQTKQRSITLLRFHFIATGMTVDIDIVNLAEYLYGYQRFMRAFDNLTFQKRMGEIASIKNILSFPDTLYSMFLGPLQVYIDTIQY